MKTQYNKKFENHEVPKSILEQLPIIKEDPSEEVSDIQIPAHKPPLALVANCSRLNVRKAPDKKSPIVAILDAGDNILIREESNADWSYISAPSGVNGYVMSIFIEKVEVTEEV